MKQRIKWQDWLWRVGPGFVIAAATYVAAGGRFNTQSGKQALYALLIIICFGMPLFWVFRVGIRWLAFQSRAKGYWATAVGIVLSFALLIALMRVLPRAIGLGCMPLGLIGGIAGSLEAKDQSVKANEHGSTP